MEKPETVGFFDSRHVIMTSHMTDRSTTFRILYYTHSNPSVLKCADTPAIGLEKSNLSRQKDFITSLRFPWGNKECAA